MTAAAVIAALHIVGFALLFPSPLAVGAGVTAYALGLRHAFDLDHIGAIDNVTRKLTADGRRPAGVGLFFALGHSTVVFAAACLVAAGVAVSDWGPGGVIGPAVSGVFLLAIGTVNLAGLVRGDGASRFYARATRAVRRPWQMYPVGLLFGLGFDTATEVALLATAAGAVAGGLPVTAVLCLPVLFAAGMTLVDTLDSAFMGRAYRGAGRRFNVVLTGASVVFALVIGCLQLASVTT